MENANYNKKQTDQVFISFRGRDQRHKFLSHLKQKLIDHKVNVFTDEDAVGQPLKNLFGQIRNSRIAIVIFSECYPESEWCWDELVWIHKCLETEKIEAVIPIFHEVEILTVTEQSEEFGQKFWDLQISLLSKKGIGVNDIKDILWRIEGWKRALIGVTANEGMTYYKNTSEADFVTKVVENVKKYLPKTVAPGERRESAERKQSNLTVFNNSRFEVNNFHFHDSSLEALEALSLGRWKPEGYNMSFDFMKPMSRDYRRNNSDLDDLYGPFPIEGLIAQKRNENQQSLDIALQQNYREMNLPLQATEPLFTDTGLPMFSAGERHSSIPATIETSQVKQSNEFVLGSNQLNVYHPQNQQSIYSSPKKKDRRDTSFVSSLRNCLKCCLCLNEPEQKMIQK